MSNLDGMRGARSETRELIRIDTKKAKMIESSFRKVMDAGARIPMNCVRKIGVQQVFGRRGLRIAVGG